MDYDTDTESLFFGGWRTDTGLFGKEQMFSQVLYHDMSWPRGKLCVLAVQDSTEHSGDMDLRSDLPNCGCDNRFPRLGGRMPALYINYHRPQQDTWDTLVYSPHSSFTHFPVRYPISTLSC